MVKSFTNKGFDEIDRQILQLLQKDTTLTNVDIARKVNLSPPATHSRVKRLEKEGYIERYTAVLNREKLGYDLLCFIYIKTNEHLTEKLQPFETAIKKMDEVLECHHITGEYDYLLKVVIKNSSDLRHFIVNKISSIENVSGVQTSLSYDVIKSSSSIPIPK